MTEDKERKDIIKRLKEYFKTRDEVALAFLFGSRAKKATHSGSDWDIGAYFKPKQYLELETKEDYANDSQIWSDLVDILKTNEVDFVVLNRAASSLVYSVLSSGAPLVIRDRKMYLDLLCKTNYEAIDWWQFADEYYKIREAAHSLTPEVKVSLEERLVFLQDQFSDLERFKKLVFLTYRDDRNERRNTERWIENLVMASLDIAKIILASDKKTIPQSYKDILNLFVSLYLNMDEPLAEKFAKFAELRNIVAHEYLDLRWEKIKKFIEEAEKFYPQFIEKVKTFIT